MDFIKHLRIATPLVWVRTDEPDRVLEVVVENVRRTIFRLDAFDGLVVYKDGDWKKVIVEAEREGEVAETTTNDFAEAMMHVVENKGTLVINNAHHSVKDLIGFFGAIYGLYREAFYDNDLNECPAQFLFLSCNAEVPPEIIAHTAYVDFPMPNNEDLAKTVAKVATQLPEDVEVEFQGLVQAGLGLTETQFIQACMLSLAQEKGIYAEFVSKWKSDMIKQGGVLEIRRPTLSLDDIGGLDLAKQIIEEAVWIWNNPEQAKEFQLEPIRRILMVGVPGSGKSAICEATAKSLNLDLAKTGISQSMNKFIGESENNMRSAFAQIKAMAPLVVWMDELGRDLSQGDYEGDGGTTSRVHGEFLTGLQELPTNVFLMAAANHIGRVAPEMLRADRFDRVMFVGLPTLAERAEILRIHLGDRAEEIDLDTVAASSAMFTGAELKQLVKETRLRVSASQQRHIETDDIVAQVPMMRNILWAKDPDMIRNMYRRAKDEWDWASSGQLEEADMIINGQLTGPVTKRTGNATVTTF